MDSGDWSRFWHNPELDIELYHAVCIKKRFPSHMHEHYVICIIENGYQTFTHRKTKFRTYPGDIILLNPGDDHTGEPADQLGFEYKAIYPGIKHINDVLQKFAGINNNPVDFTELIIRNKKLTSLMKNLHRSLTGQSHAMEQETMFFSALNSLISGYTDTDHFTIKPYKERAAVQKAGNYIHDHLDENITLTDIAEYVGLSPFYLLRIFHNEKGMPPHSYMESLRISKAKELLEKKVSLSQVAVDLGFSDQSHFTNTFKRVMGITPGQYVKAVCL